MRMGMGMRSISRHTHPHNYGQMLFDMTLQTPPLSAFAKPFAIFFFSTSNNGLPLEPLPHTFIGISNHPTFQHSNMWPAILGYHDGIW